MVITHATAIVTTLARLAVPAIVAGVMIAAVAGCAGSTASRGDPAALGLPSERPLPTAVATPFAAAAAAPWRTTGFRGGVVAASEPEAAEAGAAMLRAGGNAVDAVAAAQFALNVVEPQSSGVGGGFLMLVHLAESAETWMVDAREVAPGAADPHMFGASGWVSASSSGRAVGVPVTVAGLAFAIDRFGRLGLAEALQPAIALAEDGFAVGPRLATSIAEANSGGGRLARNLDDTAFAPARELFAPGGVALPAGAWLRQSDLARTFRLLAAKGPRVFYDCGDEAGIAPAMVAAQAAPRELPGQMTCADLASYWARGPRLRTPLQGTYRGYRVVVPGPPSAGGVALLQMLGMVERFPMGSDDLRFGSPDSLALMHDAMGLAFADRAVWLGDTDAAPGLPIATLIDPAYIRWRSASCPDGDTTDAGYCLDPATPLGPVRPGDGRAVAATVSLRAGSPETTHITVIDRAGNIASLTGTIESAFGSGLLVPGFGFLLNNELTDFNLQPQAGRRWDTVADPDPGANDIAPGKRPRSNMTPVIILADAGSGRLRPVAAFGSPGGPSIINTVFNVSLNLIDHGMAIQTAIDAPRLSLVSADVGRSAQVEPGFPAGTLENLRDRGFDIAVGSEIGSVQGIVIDHRTGVVHGGADGRRRGTVIGLDPIGPVDGAVR